MPEESCLNCKYGKPEKRKPGYYCKLPTWIYATYHPKILPPCNYYKPRPNQCKINGCEWSGKHEGEDFCYYEDDLRVGEICEHFEKKEKPMEKFEFEGKMYEAAKPISLAFAWTDNPCMDIYDDAVRIFGQRYGFTGEIALIQRNFDLFTEVMKEWLVEKGYLVEVVDEEKLLPNQWYKGNETGDLFYSDEQFRLVRMQSKGFDMGIGKMMVDFGNRYSKIDPPTITEQLDKAERYPVSCVHHKTSGCLNDRAIKHFGTKDSVSCHDRLPDGCPAYNDGKAVERRPEKCKHLAKDNTCLCTQSNRYDFQCQEGDADICGCHSCFK